MAITRAGTVGIYVSDQDRALDFYVNKLGFEKRCDELMRAGARWIGVALTGAETRLILFTPPGMKDRIGTFANLVFECDDMRVIYEERRGRGVELSEEPNERPWGLWAEFKDVDGNEFGLIQS